MSKKKVEETMAEMQEQRAINRKKKDYVVEVQNTETGVWSSVDPNAVFDDTLSARKWAVKNCPDGRYRVIAVCDAFTKRTETVQKAIIE
jgi:hypothetical protein